MFKVDLRSSGQELVCHLHTEIADGQGHCQTGLGSEDLRVNQSLTDLRQHKGKLALAGPSYDHKFL